MWSVKPPWCQPWTIVGTGSLITAGAASLNPWAGAAVGTAVLAWWWLFLVAVPGDYAAFRERALSGGGDADE